MKALKVSELKIHRNQILSTWINCGSTFPNLHEEHKKEQQEILVLTTNFDSKKISCSLVFEHHNKGLIKVAFLSAVNRPFTTFLPFTLYLYSCSDLYLFLFLFVFFSLFLILSSIICIHLFFEMKKIKKEGKVTHKEGSSKSSVIHTHQ